MHMQSTVLRALAIVALSFTAFSAPARAAVATPEPLVLSYVATNAAHWDIDAAIDKGFLRQEGFAPENATFHSPPQAVQLIVAGGVQITTVEPEPVVSAVLHGATDVGILAGTERTPDWMLIVRPEIKTWSDLKGKRLGFSALTTAEMWLTQQLLAKHGLETSEWVGIQTGLSSAKFAALEKGSIAGAVLFQPLALNATQAGFRSLADFSELGEYPSTVVVVRRSWAAAEGNGVRLSRAIRRANEWLHDPKNREEALKIVERYTKASPETAEALYRMYFVGDKLYSPGATVSLSGLARVTQVMTAQGHIPPGKAPTPESLVIDKKDGGLWK